MKKLAALAFILVLLVCCPALAAEGAQQSQGTNFILRVVNYGLFLAILIFFIRKPLAKALRSRRDGVREELELLESSREEAARAKAEAMELLSRAEEESKRLLLEYRGQAEAERERILQQAEQNIAHMYEQAKLTIEREMTAAQGHLKNELALAAVNAAEDLLRKNINPQDQARLNQDYLAELASGKVGE